MQLMTIQNFSGAANQNFQLELGVSTVDLTLVEVKPLARRPFPGMLRDPFSLLFRSGSSVILPQKTYRLCNATMGALALFLVPVARDAEGVVYQAIFN